MNCFLFFPMHCVSMFCKGREITEGNFGVLSFPKGPQDLNFLMGSLLVLGPKKCLLDCATVCVKSEVILWWIGTYFDRF